MSANVTAPSKYLCSCTGGWVSQDDHDGLCPPVPQPAHDMSSRVRKRWRLERVAALFMCPTCRLFQRRL